MAFTNILTIHFNDDMVTPNNKQYYIDLFDRLVHDGNYNSISNSYQVLKMIDWDGPRADIMKYLRAHHPYTYIKNNSIYLTTEDLVACYKILLHWREPRLWHDSVWHYENDHIESQITDKLHVLQNLMGISASDVGAMDFIFYDSDIFNEEDNNERLQNCTRGNTIPG